MVGFAVKEGDIQRISSILKFEGDENSTKVYLALLNLGSGTLGQISSLTGLDLISTTKSLESLVLRGYCGRIGKLQHYYALEPFLDNVIHSIDLLATETIQELILGRLERSSLSVVDNLSLFKDYVKKLLNSKITDSITKVKGKIPSDAAP